MKRLRLSNAIWDSLLPWLYSSKDSIEFSLNQGEKRINWCLFGKTALTVLSSAFPCVVFAFVTGSSHEQGVQGGLSEVALGVGRGFSLG